VPEIPPVSRTVSLADAVAAVFADKGPLARAVPAFEPRPGQRDMAGAVADVFVRGGVLVAEAGTGTGKTLAYLVPAILSGHRVLISTGTKNLQEQVWTKDLPLLQQALGVPLTATCMKGRGNYLCLHRYESFRDSREAAQEPVRQWIPLLDALAARSETGDRAELEQLPEELPFWSGIAASSENCIGSECSRYNDCFVTRMRQRAAESDLVIVNHHLLCADASVRQSAYGEVIPGCAYAVIDEAHQLEEVATQYFGIAVSNYRVDDLVRDGERCLALEVLLDDPGGLREAVDRVRERARMFFSAVMLSPMLSAPTDAASGASKPAATLGVPGGVGHVGPHERAASREQGPRESNAASGVGHLGPHERAASRGQGPRESNNDDRVRIEPQRLSEVAEEGAMLIGALDNLEATIHLLREPRAETSHSPVLEDLLGLSRRAVEVRDQLKFLLRANDPDYVYFREVRGRGVVLRAAPIDVSAIIREVLFDRMQATVLTSATLTVEGSFEYVKKRLGVDGAQRPQLMRLPSEFDYTSQTILYLPRRMPDPRSPSFAEAVAREVLEILRRTRGRAFVLFTSHAALRTVRALVEPVLRFPLFVQGTAPRSALLDQFRSTPHAVLLATSSFWQGVDVMGEALSCVIVDKLPFASPGDPITAARMESVQLQGGNPFSDYQVPLAILTLQQGLGRLIRHRQDRGVLAVLDPRLNTKSYGRRFLDSLPPAPVTRRLDDIGRFFGAA
jgi:ATP-dependent DNA helicase DinG